MRTYAEATCDHCGRIELHDVHDAKAFVASTIRKANLQLTPPLRQELEQAGVERLIKMAYDYRPGMGGLDASQSRFSGYAAAFLPKKLSDELHRLQGHKLRTNPDGTRTWDYDTAKPVSLQALMEAGAHVLDGIPGLAINDDHLYEPDMVADLPRLLAERREREDEQLLRYAELRRDGYNHPDAVSEMRLLPHEAKWVRRTLEWMMRHDGADSRAA